MDKEAGDLLTGIREIFKEQLGSYKIQMQKDL